MGPISRRGKMWAWIVDILRATIVCTGYTLVVREKPVCGKNANELILAKLVGVFVLCFLACSIPTRDRHERTGWMKLTEIVCSRKTYLLLIYIMVWSYIVNATAGFWNGRPITMYVLNAETCLLVSNLASLIVNVCLLLANHVT